MSGARDGTVKMWDARSGAAIMTLINGPERQTAAPDDRGNRILAVSPEAWRFLGWRMFDSQANRLRILPAEHFGPLHVG